MRFGLKSGSHTARSTTRRSARRHSRSRGLRAGQAERDGSLHQRLHGRAVAEAADVGARVGIRHEGAAAEQAVEQVGGRRILLVPLREAHLDPVARVLHVGGLNAVGQHRERRVESELRQHVQNVLADRLLHAIVAHDDVHAACPRCPTRSTSSLRTRQVRRRPGRLSAARPRAVGRVAGEAGRQHLAGRSREPRAAGDPHEGVAIDREVDGLPRLRAR